MGVLACDRKGCGSIMCDNCVESKWYVCDDCIEEFKQYVSNNLLWGEVISDERLLELFELFIEKEKQIVDFNISDKVNEFFEKYKR